VLDRIRAVPGADVAVTHESALYDLDEGTTLVRRGARTVDPGALPALPVVDGSLARLADDTVVVDQEWGRAAGDEVHVWRADGSPVTLRVAAVVRDGVGGQGAYLTTAHPAAPLAARADVRLRSPATADGLRAAVRGLGAVVVPAGPPPAAAGGPKATGLTVLLGLTLLYAGLSVAGTTVMAARDRRADLELLRLAGATTGQVRRVLAAEAVFVVLVGAVPGLAAAAVALGAQWLALLRLTGEVPALAVPWATVSAVVGAAAAVAAGTAVAAGAGVRRTG
jgi:putative ABC transport system permease protein